jgi:hypothetical protein
MSNLPYFLIAVLFIFALVLFAWFKQRDARNVRERFKDILIATYGVQYFGRESEKGDLLDSSGQLLFLKQGLFYRGRFDKRELMIPKEKLISVAVTDHHKGKLTYQVCLAIYFMNENEIIDRAAFTIPYPKQFIEAINHFFLNGRQIEVKKELLE